MEVVAADKSMIVVDTHALLWWVLEPRRLSTRARVALDESDRMGIPAIVFWEIALLARRKRIELGTSVTQWTREVLSLSRVEELPLTSPIAIEAEGLSMHSDPADRFIVATARYHACAIVTKDALIKRSFLAPVTW
jgi:PIN domain nuclease of toxin-antitoxin system